VHCWTFTPESFCDLCAQLAAENLLEFECERIIGTARYEYEFFVWMRPCTDYARNARSWRDAKPLVTSGGLLRTLFQSSVTA
jgi:hypothetical protein